MCRHENRGREIRKRVYNKRPGSLAYTSQIVGLIVIQVFVIQIISCCNRHLVGHVAKTPFDCACSLLLFINVYTNSYWYIPQMLIV